MFSSRMSIFCAVATAVKRLLNVFHVLELPLKVGYECSSGLTVVLMVPRVCVDARDFLVGLVKTLVSNDSLVPEVLVELRINFGGSPNLIGGELGDFRISLLT